MDDVWVDGGPRLLAALPCEDGAVSLAMDDGRVTFQRVFYELYANGFPAGFERMNVATIWMGGEEGRDYAVGARLSDPDGAILAEAEMVYTAWPEPATSVLLVHFSSDGRAVLSLPAPGRYTVDVLLEGVPVQTLPVFVVEVEMGKPEESVKENDNDDEE